MAVTITEESNGDDFIRREQIYSEAVALGQKWREMATTQRLLVSNVDDELFEFLSELEGLVP